MRKRIREWMNSDATDAEIHTLEVILCIVWTVTMIGLVIRAIVVGLLAVAYFEMRM